MEIISMERYITHALMLLQGSHLQFIETFCRMVRNSTYIYIPASVKFVPILEFDFNQRNLWLVYVRLHELDIEKNIFPNYVEHQYTNAFNRRQIC